jgi:lipopolysaccharide transport protein LptA
VNTHHQNHKPLGLALTLVAAVAFTSISWAELKTNAVGELTIEGDNAVFMQEANRIEYSGNVVAFMDGMRITGDKVAVQMTDDRIERIITNGEPASFYQTTAQSSEATTASATTIVFLPQTSILELTGAAALRQGGNTVNSAIIRYDLALGKLVAKGNETTTERVRMQLTLPSQSAADKEAQP